MKRYSPPTTTARSMCNPLLGLLLAATLATTNSAAAHPNEESAAPPRVTRNGASYVPINTDLYSSPIAGDGPSLDEALEWSGEHAPLIRIADGELTVAQAQREGAVLRVPDNPVFGFGAGGRTTSGTTRPEVMVSIRQPFWINGSRDARISVADAVEAVSEAERSVVLWQVHVETHRLYLKAQIGRRRVARAEAMLEYAGTHRRIAQRKVELGESAPPSVLITESNYARAQARLIEAERLEESARIELAGWIGWDDAAVRPLPVDRLPLLDIPDADALIEQMARSHPSLEARRAAIVAAEIMVELADAERTPTPSIGAEYALENEADADSQVWRLTAEIPLPVARRNQEARARASAEVDLRAARLEATGQELRTELMSTLSSLQSSGAEVALYQSSVVPRLTENLNYLLRAFELGEIDIHALVAIHEQTLDSIDEYLTSLERYYDTVAKLEGLVGTSIWQPTEESYE